MVKQVVNKQVYQLLLWAKLVPHFVSLPLCDQVLLLKAGWNELTIAEVAHRSMHLQDSLLLATGLTVNK